MSDENSEAVETVEETINKSVSCTSLPEAFSSKVTAKRHFAQFGKIHSFTLSPQRRTCTVEYETEDAAEVALIDGGFYDGEVFSIFFTPKAVPTTRPMIDYVDPDVQDELSAMLPRRPEYLRQIETVEMPLAKPMSPTRSLETKRVPRLKTISEQLGMKPLIKPVPLRPIDQVTKNELESIMKKPAYTSEEKYRVLDARDKLIRLTTSKSTDIKTATITQGVCPDMCPEKERLMREATHRVSAYELEENSKNVMKHSLALKQYARSSADQESALPHELRPEPILRMTMNYLLHNIVDLCDSSEGNIGDWFHFVWDRTRSIRKDISQQELCSQTAVSLVEQCARFHIHSAARLVAEEAQIFDQKINSENLTKCLQSLKYLYHDLNLRREQCVNEAEFRAYVVLLNLNDCQFFWEVKQFPRHILHSKEIRFAIDVYLAMANNNYVKFFNLVRQTSYMNACILLRYFNQVRVGALNTIIKAYVPKHSAAMNISYWRYILAFEDYEQTAQFFEYYGLQCDRNDDRVFLDKNSFYYPDLPFFLDRAINVVEHKRTYSVGQAIFGRPLEKFDEFLKYVPHDSFDENGFLCADAWTAEDQNYLNPPTPKRKSVHTPFREEEPVFKVPMAPSPKSSPNVKSSIFTKLNPKIEPKPLRENGSRQPSLTTDFFGKPAFSDISPLKNIFQSSTTKQTTQPSHNIFGTSLAVNSQNIFGSIKLPNDSLFKPSTVTTTTFGGPPWKSSNIFANFSAAPSTNQVMFNETANTNSISANTKKIQEEELKRLEQEKQKIEMEIRKEAESERFRKEEMDRLEREKEMHEKIERERMERERIRKEKADTLQRLQQIEQFSEEIVVEMINEFVKDELNVAATETLEYYRQIEIASEDIYDKLLAEIIVEESADWERNYQEKIEKIESTPIWLSDKSVDELVPDLMHPLQHETLTMAKRYRQGTPAEITYPATHENMIDIFDIIPQHLLKTRTTIERIRKRSTFWKCGISIPTVMEDKLFQRIEKWLDKLFIRRDHINSKIFFCEQQFVRNVRQDVAISLQKFRGSELRNEDGIVDESDLTELNAIIVVMSAANLNETKKRLQKVLEHKSENCVVGVVILNVEASQQSYLRSELGLDELTTSSDIKCFHSKQHLAPTSVSRQKLLTKCLKWVASNFKFKSLLEMQTTTSFFDQCLGDQFWHRIIASSALNLGMFKASTNIGFIIDTYNTALDHLDNIISENFSDHPRFPKEFQRFVKTISTDIAVEYQHFPCDWKNPNRSNLLHNFLKSLRLQPLSLKISSLEEIQQQLLVYSYRHINNEIRSDRAAYRMIKVLLEYLETNGNLNFQQQIVTFNWINPVRLLALEILNFQYEEKVLGIPKEVIYNREKLKRYLNDPWWLQDDSPMTYVRLSFDCADETDAPSPKKTKLASSYSDDIEELLNRSSNALEKADKQINKFKTTVSVGREITQELDSLLYEHEKNLRVQRRWSQLQISD